MYFTGSASSYPRTASWSGSEILCPTSLCQFLKAISRKKSQASHVAGSIFHISTRLGEKNAEN